jgi:ABC-type polysaccharide/polyol phosphate transport system ATPase subunit
LPFASEPPAISVQGLSLRYRTSLERKPTLKSTIVRLGRRQRTVKVIEALKDVSFDVARGSFLGVIGPNGAGKSTLLKVLAGILPPSEGRVEVRSSDTTLLTMGVGFNAELTGGENIFLGGLVSGLTPSQISERYDGIVEFTELEEFIDMPLKNYSSGMRSRLMFAVAVQFQPDILLIDEALGAGDAAFSKKAADKMKDLLSEAGAIVLVSHSLSTVRELASDCIWLHKGSVMDRGEPSGVVDEYMKFVKSGQKVRE